jgi:hypothetical protein
MIRGMINPGMAYWTAVHDPYMLDVFCIAHPRLRNGFLNCGNIQGTPDPVQGGCQYPVHGGFPDRKGKHQCYDKGQRHRFFAGHLNHTMKMKMVAIGRDARSARMEVLIS